ncbi:MAG: rhomboid family intramembrane serine protease [Bdellovibrionales bacterium]|nr:rhomboid family intramembrane serine protease [Bdellovibrionales bacterium]
MEIRTRIVKTLLGYPPHVRGIWAAIVFALINWLFSELHWQQKGWEFMVATPTTVFQEGHWWKLWTTTLIHSDAKHFLSNISMGSVWVWLTVGYYGVMTTLVGTLLAIPVIYGATLQLLEGGLIGASGVVYFLGGMWLALFVFLERRRGIANRTLRAIGVGLVIFFPTSFDPTVSYRAHWYGFLAGIVWGMMVFAVFRNRYRALEVHHEIEPELPEDFSGPPPTAILPNTSGSSVPPTFH